MLNLGRRVFLTGKAPALQFQAPVPLAMIGIDPNTLDVEFANPLLAGIARPQGAG